MKAFLLYPDRDFDMEQPLPWQAPALIQDLELNTLFNAMALGDEFLLNVAPKVVLSSLTDLNIIRYRQNILKDCLNHPAIVRSIYDLAVAVDRGREESLLGHLQQISSGDPRSRDRGAEDVCEHAAPAQDDRRRASESL